MTEPDSARTGQWAPANTAFARIRRGDRIFIGTACGEPHYLVNALVDYVTANPDAFYDTEIFHAWTLTPPRYIEPRYHGNFRANALFIGNNDRAAVNRGFADYTPVLLSQVPELFQRRLLPLDVALIQVSPPDPHGFLSLGVSVDITRQAVASARLVIAQVNARMPRVHGDSFVHLEDVDYLVGHDEPILEYAPQAPDAIAQRIGEYVARIVEDGDTLQVGYGNIPSAILANLRNKRHLGLHTELLTDSAVELLRTGVIDNTRKSLDRGKTVASFCMGTQASYAFLHDNPAMAFRPIDYTNNPLVIARQERMVAINRALSIDLTGQATAESMTGEIFCNGIGGLVDFMRGAMLAPKGKAILTLPSTTEDETASRIVPFLDKGIGVTLNRGDIHYVVTEYGIAYLQGKNIRERAMELIAIAHPKFQPWLIEEAKKANLIYRDQLFIPGKRGEYPADLETYRVTRGGLEILLRPIKISDEPLFKELAHALSDQSLYFRFFSSRTDFPHEFLQRLVVIDYTQKMAILATRQDQGQEVLLGVGRYYVDKQTHSAELYLVVRDDCQKQGIGREILAYLTDLARKRGLLSFSAEILLENQPALILLRHFFEGQGFTVRKTIESGVVNFEFKLRESHHG
ncbi:MAG: GNAT family N-acetyltransferase [Gammaproteobacteria bacterium]|nr:GNAT family N-acetyltransferase [Gammaproteobacteria bacterium]MCP5425608.1 GNAT family N-acetyltransferase [Gammaproteobacteria bacterium]MCP5458992.1 GNAT family N-acetyltransferase [Gammaproteobacteria bacterium]